MFVSYQNQIESLLNRLTSHFDPFAEKHLRITTPSGISKQSLPSLDGRIIAVKNEKVKALSFKKKRPADPIIFFRSAGRYKRVVFRKSGAG